MFILSWIHLIWSKHQNYSYRVSFSLSQKTPIFLTFFAKFANTKRLSNAVFEQISFRLAKPKKISPFAVEWKNGLNICGALGTRMKMQFLIFSVCSLRLVVFYIVPFCKIRADPAPFRRSSSMSCCRQNANHGHSLVPIWIRLLSKNRDVQVSVIWTWHTIISRKQSVVWMFRTFGMAG